MQEAKDADRLSANDNGAVDTEGVHASPNRVELTREDGTFLASAVLEMTKHVGTTNSYWKIFVLRDVRLGHKVALSHLFGMTLPQLFDGCCFFGENSHFLLHTTVAVFRTVPVRVDRLELVLPPDTNFPDWDAARLRCLGETGRVL